MRRKRSISRVGLLAGLVCLTAALWAPGAVAEPGSFPRGTADQTFTTTRAGSPTGIGYDARYHAAGDEQGHPPYLERMTFHPPPGFRYDTSVPDQCTASDFELQLRGPNACPAGSWLGNGRVEGIVQSPFADPIEFDHFTHPIHIINNAGEQIVLVESEGYTVIRGKFLPDGSLDFVNPTCFPVPPTGCLDDHVLVLSNATTIPAYTRATADGMRSYATTPPRCPRGRHWSTTIEFLWSDGSTDNVLTRQPCSRR